MISPISYLDPPFKSDADYNVLITEDVISSNDAQMTALKDTWTWDEGVQNAFDAIQDTQDPRLIGLVGLINALQAGLNQTPMLAHLVNMAVRLIEIRHLMKETASMYLHCDPIASQSLKMLMDAIFDPRSFRSEIIRRRTGSYSKANR